MALADDLGTYIATNGTTSIPSSAAPVTILGEAHGDPLSPTLVRQLLSDSRIQYLANENFLNASKLRRDARGHLRGAPIPSMSESDRFVERGRSAVLPRWTEVLEDLKVRPRMILHIGSRRTGSARDHRIAQHFFAEISDRHLPAGARGVVVLGASHAAATPFFSGQTTTRMLLENKGFPCSSLRIMSAPDDEVLPVGGGDVVRLNSLTSTGPLIVDLRKPGSPFSGVRDSVSDSGRSLKEQFEYLVLAGPYSIGLR